MMPDGETTKPFGRPHTLTTELGIEICALISEGYALATICKREDMPSSGSVIRWLADDRFMDFQAAYARAREAQMELMAEEILQIADDGRNDTQTDDEGNEIVNYDNVQRAKLRVDSRKWLMSKLAWKRYGDKQQVEHSGEITLGLSDRLESARRRAVGRVVDVTPELKKLGNDAESDKDE